MLWSVGRRLLETDDAEQMLADKEAVGRILLDSDSAAQTTDNDQAAGRQLLQRRCKGCKYYKWCKPGAAAAAAAAAGGSAASAAAAASAGKDSLLPQNVMVSPDRSNCIPLSLFDIKMSNFEIALPLLTS